VNSDTDLRVSRSLELLASLQATAADFAKREELLGRELRTRRSALNRRHAEALARLDGNLAIRVAEIEDMFRNSDEYVRAVYEGRRKTTQQAVTTGIRTLPARARQRKERWKGDLQMRHFRAERILSTDLATADAAHADITKRLAEQRRVLDDLRQSAWKSFYGYPTFHGMVRRAQTDAPASESKADDPEPLYTELLGALATSENQLAAFRRILLPHVFRYLPLALVIPLIAFGALALAFLQGFGPHTTGIFVSCGVLLAVICAAYRFGLIQAKSTVAAFATSTSEAERLIEASAAAAAAKLERDRERAQAEFARTCTGIEKEWGRSDDIAREFERTLRVKIEKQALRLSVKIEDIMRPKLKRIAETRDTERAQIEAESAAQRAQLTATYETEIAAVATDEKTRWDALIAEWQQIITPLYEAVNAMNAVADALFPPWSSQLVESWIPPVEFKPATKFASFDANLATTLPKDPRLALPGSAQFSLPLALTYPDHGSLLFETKDAGSSTVIGTINNVILRLLATTPPGKITFTILDPVGLGENFAGLMHIADHEESVINRRIWTQREQIEERLGELSEHIEKVIQMYLRNEFATITEYNLQAGSVAEKYHFLVVADFPSGFSETAARRLQSIASSGARCGIFTLIHWDHRHDMPDGLAPEELRRNSICIRHEHQTFMIGKGNAHQGVPLLFDPPPPDELAVELVNKIGKASVDSNRVEVPFVQVAPKPEERWKAETTNELRVAVGRTGATKLQYLAIGKGTRQHALFAGKTGSGKSTLFHVIITNLALACSPEQVEFYLIDFKKGVEFKCYASKRLPHARVVAIESDREFGLSVLQRVDEELKRRGDMFRKLGVQDIAGYKKAGGTEPMPRSLLIIDEFQEFFVDDDTIAQTASLLFDRIVRQGRAFGIHVLLGSQSLGGAYSLARATLGQMVIRVALQCNEADAYLIMDDTNSAPRLLSRPGEGIYNDAGGAIEGNSPFQVVWLPDDERDEWLDEVQELAAKKHGHYPSPIVFEGNAPAAVRENDLFTTILLQGPPSAAPVSARTWLGAPNSIKGPTQAVFQRQSGNHLLIVGQRDEPTLTMIGLTLLALAAQHPAGSARFFLFNSAAPGTPEAAYLDRIVAAVPHSVTVAHGNEVVAAMDTLAEEFKGRSTGSDFGSAPSIYILIHGLHRFKKLRHEDDFSFSSGDGAASPGAQLTDIITEGSTVGMHLIVTIDTFNNVNRSMNRKALSEFEMRVVFQMSANDSASLIDSPKASALGLHRAIFYNEHDGTLETFRPYAQPDEGWLSAATTKLQRTPAHALR
jgi:ABC-type multidrug transport system fused ATPase/permease subunit